MQSLFDISRNKKDQGKIMVGVWMMRGDGEEAAIEFLGLSRVSSLMVSDGLQKKPVGVLHLPVSPGKGWVFFVLSRKSAGQVRSDWSLLNTGGFRGRSWFLGDRLSA
jgi:hypothetical protein